MEHWRQNKDTAASDWPLGRGLGWWLAGAWPGEERGQGAASLKDAPEAGMRIAESSLVVNQIEKTGDPPECLKVAVFEEVVERAGVGPS